MNICPECQHENEEDNTFCDKCGTFLTHKNCPECGERVLIGQKNCPQCGALTVNIYTCIVSQNYSASPKFAIFQGTAEEELSDEVESELNTEEFYLDPQCRYCLVSPNVQKEIQPFAVRGDQAFYALEIMNLQPLKKSTLDSILETVEGLDKQSLMDAGIPAIAFPYLTLAEFAPSIPELVDGWTNTDTEQQFVVISQSKPEKSLPEYLANTELTSAQVFEYLDYTARLWKGLSRINYCQSFLQETNLGVDSEDSVILAKLEPDNPNIPVNLDDFLKIWLILLEKAGRSEVKSVMELLDQVKEDEIKNINELREQIQSLIQEAQLNLMLQGQDEEALLIPAEDELAALSGQFEFEDEPEEYSDTLPTVISNTNTRSSIDDQPTVVLPMRLLKITDGAYSDIGRKRSHNEDCFAISSRISKQETPGGTKYEGRAMYIVCDGMGGHAAGEVASAMAVKILYDYFQEKWQDSFPTPAIIEEGIYLANKNIYNANLEKGSLGSQRMGTTLVMALVEGTKLAIAHVGDSRIYRLTRKWGLEQLTVDHSVAQAEIKNGVKPELAFSRPDAYQLTQALGPRDNNFVHPDIKIMEIKEDILLLLCSDGLCDNSLLETHWQEYLNPLISSKANLEEGLAQLIDLANQVNGHDNITVVASRIKVQPNIDSQRPFIY
jgi:protein phosphatase